MVHKCCVLSCKVYSNDEKHKLFQIPSIRKNALDIPRKLTELRRARWLRACKSTCKPKNQKVCSRHFVSGRPAENEATDHIDWVPSLNLPDDPESRPVSRFNDAAARSNHTSDTPHFDVDGKSSNSIPVILNDASVVTNSMASTSDADTLCLNEDRDLIPPVGKNSSSMLGVILDHSYVLANWDNSIDSASDVELEYIFDGVPNGTCNKVGRDIIPDSISPALDLDPGANISYIVGAVLDHSFVAASSIHSASDAEPDHVFDSILHVTQESLCCVVDPDSASPAGKICHSVGVIQRHAYALTTAKESDSKPEDIDSFQVVVRENACRDVHITNIADDFRKDLRLSSNTSFSCEENAVVSVDNQTKVVANVMAYDDSEHDQQWNATTSGTSSGTQFTSMDVDKSYHSNSPLYSDACVQTDSYLEKEFRQLQLTVRKYEEHIKTLNERQERLDKNLQDARGINRLSLASLERNDKKCRYFTGLSCGRILKHLCNSLLRVLPESEILSKDQMLILTLRKLRLNEAFCNLGYTYHLPQSVIAEYFYETLNAIFPFMRNLVKFPPRNVIRQHMPLAFRHKYKDSVTVIIDCFEVNIETPNPKKMKANANVFSNYKKHKTIKILIGISAAGSIIYASESFGGRTSDKEVVRASGFLNEIKEGDFIMADRGFLIEEYLTPLNAAVSYPAFKKKNNQLEPMDAIHSKELSSLRIHVERLIGVLRQKYLVLNDTIPMSLLQRWNNDTPAIDQIIVIASALVNLCPSVVSA